MICVNNYFPLNLPFYHIDEAFTFSLFLLYPQTTAYYSFFLILVTFIFHIFFERVFIFHINSERLFCKINYNLLQINYLSKFVCDFFVGRDSNLVPCMFYELSMPIELSSRRQFVCDLLKLLLCITYSLQSYL